MMLVLIWDFVLFDLAYLVTKVVMIQHTFRRARQQKIHVIESLSH